MTPLIIKDLQSLPIVKAKPQWWMLKVFNGFGPHMSSSHATEIRHKAKFLSLKKRKGPAQDIPYDLIIWYVSKIIYLS